MSIDGEWIQMMGGVYAVEYCSASEESWRQRKCPSTVNGYRCWGACTRWNTAQPQRRRKQCHLQQHGWDDHTKQSLSEGETNATCCHLYVGPNDPLEKTATAARCRDPAWETPWTEEPGRLESMRLRRGGHDWETKQQQRQMWHKWTCLWNRNSQTDACQEGRAGRGLTGRRGPAPVSSYIQKEQTRPYCTAENYT